MQKLCELLSTNFPDMWKLGQAYFGRELLPQSAVVDHTKHAECKVVFIF